MHLPPRTPSSEIVVRDEATRQLASLRKDTLQENSGLVQMIQRYGLLFYYCITPSFGNIHRSAMSFKFQTDCVARASRYVYKQNNQPTNGDTIDILSTRRSVLVITTDSAKSFFHRLCFFSNPRSIRRFHWQKNNACLRAIMHFPSHVHDYRIVNQV